MSDRRDASPRLPWSAPRWPGPRLLALVTTALGGAAVSYPSIAWLGTGGYGLPRAAPIATATLSAALVALALLARRPSVAAVACAGGGIVAGALNAGLTFSLQALLERHGSGEVVSGFVFATIVGAVFGGPLGLLFGSAYAPVVASAARARQRRALDAAEPLHLLCGGWLAAAGIASATVRVRGVPPIASLPTVAIGLGVLLTLGAAVRALGRARFLARVYAGRDARFALGALGAMETTWALRPLALAVPEQLCDATVVRQAASPEGVAPYRGREHQAPCALTPRDPARVLGAARRRAAAALALLAIESLLAAAALHVAAR